MEYLLKVTAVVTIFYFIYKLFLQRDTFFESNRWFLIIGLISSLLIPFLVIPIYIEYTPVLFDNVTINREVVTEPAEKPFNILDYLPLIYGLGVLFFLGRFLIQLFSLIKIIYKNKGIKKDGYIFIETQNSTPPFSFFKWIVYNPKAFSQTELEHIIEHEKTHAKQYHSVDILTTQLFCVLLWFNPFMWLYNKDLKQNLEFIADKRTLNQYNCKKSYQYTLLKTSMPSHQMALSNHFYNSLIKKRIVMLHKSKSKKINQLKYALVIPIMALFLMGFNTKDIYVEKQNPEKPKTFESSKKDSVTEEYQVIITKDFTDADFKNIIEESQEKGIKLSFNNIKRNEKNEIVSIDAAFVNNVNGSGTYNLKGKDPIKSFAYTQNENGFGFQTVWQTNLIIGKPSETDTLNLNTQSPWTVTTEEQTSPWKVTSERNNTIFVSGDTIYTNDKPNSIEKLIQEFTNTPLFLIDGKEVSEKKIRETNPLLIESVLTIKGDNAVKEYGNKAKNGVISVTLRSSPLYKHNITIRGISNKEGTSPLTLVNGKEISDDDLEKLNPENIYSVNVLKDEKSTSLYGEKAKNGVVLITTKGNTTSFERKTMNEMKVIGYGANQGTTSHNITFESVMDGKPILVIVDGKEMPNKNFEDIDQNTIGSIKVLKGEDAIKKYGKKAENGVIEITSKKFVEGKPLSNVKIIGQGEAYTITKTENMFFIDSVGGDKQPLFVLDGKETKYIEITKVSPEKIENVIVLKDKSATKKYGKKGENGVIEITTKK